MAVSVDIINNAALTAAMGGPSQGPFLDGTAEGFDEVEALNLEEAQRCLANGFLDAHQLYRDGDCVGNVTRFLGFVPVDARMNRLNVIEVLHSSIGSKDDFCGLPDDKKIWPRASLLPDKWSYHVALEFGGRVYDFDYTGEPGVPLADYAEEMFGSALACFDYIVIPRESLLGEGRVNIFDRAFSRLPIADFVEVQAERYGRMSPLGLERREDNFERWGLLRESDLFKDLPKAVKARHFCLTYAAGKAFNWTDFATLLKERLAFAKRKRPRLRTGSVEIWLKNSPDVDAAQLRSLVDRAIRPQGIDGVVDIVLRSYLDPMPRTYRFEG
ncbi:MAG: hypothetical protein WC690_01550 [bacterium]